MNNCNCCCEFVKLTHSPRKNEMGANKYYCNWFCGINRYLKEQYYNGFPQTNTVPFTFSRIKHIPLVMMDVFSRCCEINTVPST